MGADVSAELFSDTAPSIRDAVRSVRKRYGNIYVEVVMKIGQGQSTASEQAYLELSRVAEAGQLEAFDRAKIAYRSLENGRADSHDFIQEAVTFAADVDLEDETNQPTEASASEAIAASYNNLRDDIMSALRSTN